jgi:hypothetical protein
MAILKTDRRTGAARSAITRKTTTRSASRPIKSKPARGGSSSSSSSRRQNTVKPSRAAASRKTPTRKTAKAVGKKALTRGATKPVTKPVTKVVKKAVKKAVSKPVTKAAAPPRRTVVASPAPKRRDLDRQQPAPENASQTPPSSLDMDRHGTAARSGSAALRASLKEHTGMTPELTAGDVDANWENAYFSGEEAPGGDNPSPEENVVEDIGKALGIEYQDGETLKGSNKIVERDEHRWELDPGSAEDYKDRK